MKVSSLLKVCGSQLVEIREGEEKSFETIAVIDYNMKSDKVDGIYFPCRVQVTDEINNRKVDFFTSSKCFDYNRNYKDCIEVYVK